VGEHVITAAENEKDVYAVVTGQTVVRGLGGFGFKGAHKLTSWPKKPSEAPTYTVETRILPGQGFLYRLNGDINPLHVDPEMAKIAGFPMPIIHGLCTKGVCAKAVYEKFTPNHPELIKKVASKFVGHVFPGEHLIVDMWK
jgi:3-hydroxyacyl-CoA dehydrogenase/3a,7a,12a-trihydroxy-5b-cholest-24-enoyl-CoA hydratase/multifunctional beta-oxidation protein/peroxisomal enoyl-CoA hydratase 2